MPWTREEKLNALIRLPWTVNSERSNEGYVVLRARELPGTIATGSVEEVEQEFWDSLRATLACYLDFDDPIPLPGAITRLPWEEQHLGRVSIHEARPAMELFVETASVGALALSH